MRMMMAHLNCDGEILDKTYLPKREGGKKEAGGPTDPQPRIELWAQTTPPPTFVPLKPWCRPFVHDRREGSTQVR